MATLFNYFSKDRSKHGDIGEESNGDNKEVALKGEADQYTPT